MMCHENAHERSQRVLPALVATALALTELLDSIFQLLSLELGCLFVEVVTCQKFVNRVDAEVSSASDCIRQKGRNKTHLKDVSSLKLPPPSSSSETFLLCVLELGLEFCREFTAEGVRDDCRDCALLETVLPLSRARLRRSSCMIREECEERESSTVKFGRLIFGEIVAQQPARCLCHPLGKEVS